MRNVLIDLSSDNYLHQSKIFGGYEGEHNETVLQVKLPERMLGNEISYYRFEFQTSEDNRISSPSIFASKLNNDILSFNLTEQLTIAGELLFNVVAESFNGETISLRSKTNMIVLCIEKSPEGNNIVFNSDGHKDEILELVDQRILEINPTEVDQIYNSKSPKAQSGIAIDYKLSEYIPLNADLEIVFDGGDSDTAVDNIIVPDSEMSDESENSVKNRIIKAYVDNVEATLKEEFTQNNQKLETTITDVIKEIENVDEKISFLENEITDHKIEQGTMENWRYCKWTSGRVEAWFAPTSSTEIAGNAVTKINIPVPEGIFSETPNFIQPSITTGSSTAAMGMCVTAADISNNTNTNISINVYNASEYTFRPRINVYAVQF